MGEMSLRIRTVQLMLSHWVNLQGLTPKKHFTRMLCKNEGRSLESRKKVSCADQGLRSKQSCADQVVKVHSVQCEGRLKTGGNFSLHSFPPGEIKVLHRMGKERPQSVCVAGQWQQPVAEAAPLPGDDGVQWVKWIVHNWEEPAQSPLLCHSCWAVQLCAHNRACLPNQLVQTWDNLLLYAASPVHCCIEEGSRHDSLIKHLQQLFADVERRQSS